MRLLQRGREGVYTLKELKDKETPPYAILSHTWFLDNDLEVSFGDLTGGCSATAKPDGYGKLRFCCEQAAKDGLTFSWVDTCCINKDSSTELQEAITSMFSWYRKSARCYVYLADVSVSPSSDGTPPPLHLWETAFRNSRWFTRGWTLQELIAPDSVEFFSKEGIKLGDKTTLRDLIHDITRIPMEALRADGLEEFTVEDRLSWARNRQTKRVEDKAYCLLGIVNVFMPLLYGEESFAWTRLRDEIEKKHTYRSNFLSMLPHATEAAFNSKRNQDAPMCLKGTRPEVLEDIAAWISGDDHESFICSLDGIAGTGKTAVARTLARIYHDENKLGASFFFSPDHEDLSRANMLVTTLAWQLATQIPKAGRHIRDAISRQRDLQQSLQDQWEQLVINPLCKLPRQSPPATVLLIINALHECDNDNDIRAILKSLAASKLPTNIQLRILITSRPRAAIRQGIRRIPSWRRKTIVLHEIPQTQVNRDLAHLFENHLSAVREQLDFDEDWPGSHKIKRLVETSSGLFAWAAAACDFISEGRRQSSVNKRIDSLVNGFATGTGPEERLDKIYVNVLKFFAQQHYDDERERTESYAALREVLGTLVSLYSPLPMKPLAKLLKLPVSDVKAVLNHLHTILQIPDDDSQPIRLHHPFFRDFLLNKERCSDLNLWIDQKQAHKALGDNCLDLMSRKLRMNICDLDSPSTQEKDLDPERINHCIPPDLQYACLHWVEHYRQSGIHLNDGDVIDVFFRKHFLHWLEATSIMGKSSEQGAIIRTYHSLLRPQYNEFQIPFVKDARRLMFKFQDIIKLAPLQVYGSVLTFAPPGNRLKLHFQDQKQPWIEDIQIAEPKVQKVKDDFNYVSDLAFTLDGNQIVSGSNFEAVRAWNVATRGVARKYEGNSTDKISTIAISPDGKVLAAGSDDSFIMAWDVETGALLYSTKAHTGWINSIAFSSDGKTLISGSADQSVVLYDAATGEETRRFENNSSAVNSIAFSPDGQVIATGSVDELVRLWDISNGTVEILMTLDGHSGPINAVRFAPDGVHIASGSDDTRIKLWDVNTGIESLTLTGHTSRVIAVAFSWSGRYIASGSEDKTVRVWDATRGSELVALKDHTTGINAIVFNPNDTLLASSSFDDEVRIWDICPSDISSSALVGKLDDFEDNGASLDQVPCLPWPNRNVESSREHQGHSSMVTRVVISLDGKWVASGSQDMVVKLWTDGQERWTLKGHTGSINDLQFSPNSRLVASGSSDCSIRLWDVETGSQAHLCEGHAGPVLCVSFSSDGRILGSSSADQTARLWDSGSGAALRRFDQHTNSVTGLTFSPDGQFVVTWSRDTTALIWDLLARNNPPIVLDRHRAPIDKVTLSQEGDILLSCSTDGMVCVWRRNGAFVLASRAAGGEPSVRPRSTSGTRDWLSTDSKDLLWLPDGYHATDVATFNNMMVVGHASGSISFLRLRQGVTRFP